MSVSVPLALDGFMRRRTDTWIGLLLLVFCGAMYAAGSGLPKAPYGTMGPAYMPNLILAVTAALSLLLVLKSLISAAGSSEAPSPSLWSRIVRYRNILISFGFFFLFALLLPFLGYVVTSFVFLLFLQVALGPKTLSKVPLYLGVSVGITLLLFLIFRCMLLVILPESDFDFFRGLEDGVHVLLCGSWEGVTSLWK